MNGSAQSEAHDGPDQRAHTVLVVDDDAPTRRVFVAALAHAGYHPLQATGGEEALELLRTHEVDLALLDLEMPGLSGIDLVNRVRADPRSESISLILVSGHGGLPSKLAGLDAGANDYLVKPVALQELLARVATHLRDRSLWLGRLDDQLRARAGLARRIADLDPATPLPTLQRQLLGILSAELPLEGLLLHPPAERQSDQDAGLSIAPTTHGTQIRIPLRSAGTLVGILEATVETHPERTVSTLSDLAPQLGAVVATSLREEGSAEEARQRLRQLLADGALSSVFQPIVMLEDQRVVGYEALARFADGTPPDVAFDRAGREGIGPELEVAAIECHLAAAASLPAAVWVSLNVSAATFLTGAIDPLLTASTRALVLEVTENEHIEDYVAVRERLARFPHIRAAVDDAGAGYASLRHIFELRPDLIKLDRSWIADIDSDPVRQALVHGLLGFAGAVDARLVAEGVERREEAEAVHRLGVAMAQGYLFGRPAPAPDADLGAA